MNDDAETVIHTGWWGCGAFGGNQELMALLQLLAAEWAGVDEVVFHTGTDGEAALASAREVIAELPEDIATEDLVVDDPRPRLQVGRQRRQLGS